MPTYPYACHGCDNAFDVIKSVSSINDHENCPACDSSQTKRLIAKSNLDKSSHGEPFYEPALGCIIKSKSHKRRILKEKGLEEVGTTSPDTMYKDLELQREKRIARSWDNI